MKARRDPRAQGLPLHELSPCLHGVNHDPPAIATEDQCCDRNMEV